MSAPVSRIRTLRRGRRAMWRRRPRETRETLTLSPAAERVWAEYIGRPITVATNGAT